MTEPSTPLMRQYASVKKEHPTALLFFRLGDFYELFFDDAVLAARELQITLTARNKEKGHAIPMCGVPYHAAEGYIAKLTRRGFKVAICEQMEDAAVSKAVARTESAKKLVRREVTRVVTPGTAADSSLGSDENNFLAAVAEAGERVGFAALDLSTGEFRTTEFAGENAARRVQEELEQLRPKELLYASAAPLFENRSGFETRSSFENRPSFENRSGLGKRDDPGRPSGGGDAPQIPPRPPGTAPMPSLGLPYPRPRSSSLPWAETPLEDWIFAPDHAIPLLENHFGVLSLEGFGLSGRPAAAAAAGAILYYVRSTQRGSLDHVDRIGWYERQNCLVLDAVTVRNLELIEPLFAASDAGVTLLRSIDAAVTPMGKRLLRAWLLRPSLDLGEINQRLDAVEVTVNDLVAREELRRALDGVLDLERLLSRVTLETANPRDVLALAASIAKLPLVKAAAGRLLSSQKKSGRLAGLHAAIDELGDLRVRIETSLVPEPPLSFSDGGVIAANLDAELDQLRELSRNSKQVLAEIEQRERNRTGIGSLKVKFNSIFGYYLEVSKPNLHLAPADYERKQTLVGAERFTTPELKEYEAKILDAQEKIVEIERRLFAELRAAIAAEARRIRQSALAVAEVDVLGSLAHIAALRNYCRPKFVEPEKFVEQEKDEENAEVNGGVNGEENGEEKNDGLKASEPALSPGWEAGGAGHLSREQRSESGLQKKQDESGGLLEIIEGRHPVIEQQELGGAGNLGDGGSGGTHVRSSARFVPNDLFLNSTTHNIVLLTGPNMGGKSTYLRQAALTVILAQMGSFVPARSVRLSLVDRVFTRIGASDNLARGRSTFMVEMTETAAILHSATPKSLILLDEVGRGTSTYDGLAIAWAAVEYLHARVGAKTLFATHYFELTELAGQLEGVKNYHVAVKETGGGIVFLRKVAPGAADRSYGIEVAKLAGLPQEVIARAREVLDEHESAERLATAQLAYNSTPNASGAHVSGTYPHAPAQLTIFTPLSQPVLDQLRAVDLNRLTPLEALNLLSELKKQID
jgi:DNA mismatch repair protein MutS